MSYASLIPHHLGDADLVRIGQLANWLGVSFRTVKNWIAAGRLPRPAQLSPRVLVWQAGTLRAALRQLDNGNPVANGETA